jgi:hypothetical protein
LRIERLDQPTRGTGGTSLLLHGVGRLGSEHQDRHGLVLRQGAQVLDQCQTVHARHVLVGENQVERLALRLFQSVHTIHGIYHLIARAFEGKAHHLTDGSGIVDREDGFGHI